LEKQKKGKREKGMYFRIRRQEKEGEDRVRESWGSRFEQKATEWRQKGRRKGQGDNISLMGGPSERASWDQKTPLTTTRNRGK